VKEWAIGYNYFVFLQNLLLNESILNIIKAFVLVNWSHC